MAEVHDDWVRSFLGFDPMPSVGEGLTSAGHKVAGGVAAAGQKIKHAGQAILSAADKLLLQSLAAAFLKEMQQLDEQIKQSAKAGLDPRAYVEQAKELGADHEAALKLTDEPARLLELAALVVRAKDAADRATADNTRGRGSVVEGISKAVTDLRNSAKAMIEKLPPKDDQRPELGKRLNELDKAIQEQTKITDRTERAKKLKQIDKLAEALLDAAAAAAKDPAAVQATYQQALQDRYGFTVKNPGALQSHNDQLYKMFQKVPDTDVTQDKLSEFDYSDKMPEGGVNKSGFYTSSKIVLTGFDDDWILNYKDPVTKIPQQPNAFAITTLHELGHSVDDRFGIMRAHQGSAGAGGWQEEQLEHVADAYVRRFLGGPGKKVAVDKGQLHQSVADALTGKDVSSLPGVSAQDWKSIKPMLDQCVTRSADKSFWDKEDDIDGRCYQQSYANRWTSYASAARSKSISVSKYQWRAPGEFFAELYAWTFYNSKLPPSGIDPALAAYMFGGKTAEAPPAKH